MTKEQLSAYLIDLGQELELKGINDTIYVKWDHLPYKIRQHVFDQPGYDQSKMVNAVRECQCGTAFFYEADAFFNFISNLDIHKDL